MLVERISPTQEAILMALAHYRFLTADQLLRINGGNRHHLYETLRTMCSRKKRPPIARIKFGVTVGIGTLANIHHLTKYGAEIIAELAPQKSVDFPRRSYAARNDYFHRLATVDCHIALDQWAQKNGATVDTCSRYFDRGQAGGFPRTHLDVSSGVIVPDMVFSFIAGDIKRLCCLEVYRRESTKKITESLSAYAPALADRSLNEALRFSAGVRILAVFETQKALELVRKRLAIDASMEAVKEYYFMATLEGLQADFKGCWVDINGTKKSLF